jgi:hypothetical protein
MLFSWNQQVSVLGRNEWEIRLDKQLLGTGDSLAQPAER